MGIRETLNKNQPIVLGVVIVVILATVYVIYSQTRGSSISIATKSYYTTDDGATYFPDDVSKLPPFDSGGKQAVRCYVFKCGSDTFVGYLERYTPEYKAQLAKMTELSKSGNTMPPGPEIAKIQALQMSGVEIKKPGDKEWAKAFGPAARMRAVACKDGKPADSVSP